MALPSVLRTPLSRSTQLLLDSRIPARLAWVDGDGLPQVAPMWFEWVDGELLMSSLVGARKLDDLTDGVAVAVTIDTDEFPHRSVRLTGTVTTETAEGLTDSYRRCAERYLGPEAAAEWCANMEGRSQVLLRVRPRRASESDLSTSAFFRGPAER
ncbi:MAG: pyridoxamine 5'-phosphate oxidase family protein [Actinomycetota bacterium]